MLCCKIFLKLPPQCLRCYAVKAFASNLRNAFDSMWQHAQRQQHASSKALHVWYDYQHVKHFGVKCTYIAIHEISRETLNQGPRIIPTNHTHESHPESYPRIIPLDKHPGKAPSFWDSRIYICHPLKQYGSKVLSLLYYVIVSSFILYHYRRIYNIHIYI